MKAEYLDLKKGFGEIRLIPEVIDDLWHLGHLVRVTDLVYATSLRTVDIPSDKLRPEKAEKRPVRLGIRVEKVAFHPHSNRLRISGTIEHGSNVGSYHTFNIEPNIELSVIKQWSSMDLDRIERAVQSSAHGSIHILTIEEGEAQLFRIRQFGPELVETLAQGSGKREGFDGKSIFFKTILEHLMPISGYLIIAGPGFIKDDFMKYIHEHGEPLTDRCLIIETRGGGRGAVQEVIGQGVLERLIGDFQLEKEVRLMDEFLERLAKEQPVAYGVMDVRDAVSCGASEQVLVIDTLLRDSAIQSVLEQAERTRAKINVLSTEFEPGIKLAALGGIGALLRFKIK